VNPWLLLAVSILATCAGQLLQKCVADRWRAGPRTWRFRLTRPALPAAIASLALGAAAWLLLLQQWDVGMAYPMLSLNFVLVTLAARAFFHETIDARHWFGVALIVGGIVLLGSTA